MIDIIRTLEQELDQQSRLYEPLSSEDIQQIHNTSMRVLEEVGFEVTEPEALALFDEIGAEIDTREDIVRLNESQVMDVISSVPRQVTLCGRQPDQDVQLGAGNVYFGTGGTAMNILDHGEDTNRPATLQDLVDIVRLVDQLDNIHVMLLPTYPTELPVEDVDVHRFLTGMMYTSKHVMGGIYTQQGVNDVIRMAEKLAGSPEGLRERPFISIIACGISPLRLDSKYGKFIIQLARKGIPVAVPVEPLSGATAPITLAGTLVMQNCDGLIHIMLTQLADPGAPAIYGSVASSVNMQDLSYLGGPVESGMLNAASAQLARFYGFPYYSTAGISDSKTLDAQSGYESAINNLLVAMAGGDFIHDAAGLMEFATTVSKEKLIIDNEILGMVMRVLQGIEVNADTLAFETIKEVGPGGNFVAGRHTRTYMHEEHYTPALTNRDKRETWITNGGRTTAEEAHECVEQFLAEDPTLYVEEDTLEQFRGSFPNIQADLFQNEPVSTD